jgi:hypothetical protein
MDDIARAIQLAAALERIAPRNQSFVELHQILRRIAATRQVIHSQVSTTSKSGHGGQNGGHPPRKRDWAAIKRRQRSRAKEPTHAQP